MTINRKIDGTTHMSMTPAPLDSKPQGAQDEISRDLRTLANVYIKHGSPDYKAMIEAAERIEKLERQCETYRNAANEAHRLLQTTYDERDTALRALAEARRDAERMNCLVWLAAQDVLFFSTYDESKNKHDSELWFPAINCGDTFAYACADAESLAAGQESELRRIYEQFGYAGVVAWCAIKRGIHPLKQLQTPEYFEARAAINAARQPEKGANNG